ncbi:MAG: DUF1697 domain-containing protein [Sandaracinaceae bacterium]|nr:DUF1697 domain-containing protein [Sandaracinaceae bacterium]
MPGATHIAFLRGINVGGKRSLPMKHLAAIFEAAGGEDVRTYIQSGNVVFRTRRAAGLAERVTENIEEQFGFQVPTARSAPRAPCATGAPSSSSSACASNGAAQKNEGRPSVHVPAIPSRAKRSASCLRPSVPFSTTISSSSSVNRCRATSRIDESGPSIRSGSPSGVRPSNTPTRPRWLRYRGACDSGIATS